MITITDLEVESNDVLYAGRYENIYKIDISDIDAITETAHISLSKWSKFSASLE